MQNVTLVGIDLGKHSFHVHGQDRTDKAVFRKKLSRKQFELPLVFRVPGIEHYAARFFSC